MVESESVPYTTFKQLFVNYYGRFVRFADTYVRNRAVAEDFTTEAFMHYWEHRDSLGADLNVPAYILTIIKNKSLNYLEHLQVREATAEKIRGHAEWELHTRITTLEACNPGELFATEVREIVTKALASMPAKTREIFELSRFQNKSYKEIASQLDLSEKSIEFHISKAIKLLRSKLKDYLPVCFPFLL
ncbi:MAG: RNA polymerase sigma-70 factor [Tannerellaceae bacterium]|jgi:RNA polymerase sigma-70 factor (ECF subfamily)|nr:RNA polymerase sigma-70 factor [Tannerellaceae bacterium]